LFLLLILKRARVCVMETKGSASASASTSRARLHSPSATDLIPASTKEVVSATHSVANKAVRDVFNLGYKDLDMAKLSLIMPLGNASIRILTYPPSLVKTRMMANLPQGAVAYTSTRQAFSSITSAEGFPALYRGFSVSLLTLPLGTIYVNTMERCKAYLTENTSLTHRHPLTTFCAAGFASAFTQTFGVPIDVISQRLMLIRTRNSQTKAIHVARDILKAEGPRGLYRGYVASLLCFAPHSAIVWSIYSNTRHFARSKINSESSLSKVTLVGYWNAQEALITAGSGFFAGLSASLITNPLDVIRTRQQTQAEVMNYRQTVQSISSTMGLSGFYRGAWARTLAMGPSAALVFSSYEILKQLVVKN